MFVRSILARAFFVLSLAMTGVATTIAFAPRAQAQTGFYGDCPNSECRNGSQLCCTHQEGPNTFYYYKN